MLWPEHAVFVTCARSMRVTANHRIASRVWHHATRYHWLLVDAKSTGSTSRVVSVPVLDVYRMRRTSCSAIASSSADRIVLGCAFNEELDKLTVDAAERTASVTNKASFLAVSAGVLVAASTAQLWEALAPFGVAALALSCAALACAAVAVRPGKRIGIQARRLVDRFSDSASSALQIEAQGIEDKASVLSLREDDLRARAVWVWCGFAALALAAASLTVVFAAEVLGG